MDGRAGLYAGAMNPASYSWVRPRPGRAEMRVDAIMALVLAFAATTTSLLYARVGLFEDPAPAWLWALGLGLCTLPLALRRIAPIPVAVVVAIGFFVCGQFAVPEILIINICLFVALYTVGAWERNRVAGFWTLFGVSTALILWLVITIIISSSTNEEFMGMPRSGLFSAYATYAVIQIITNLLYFGGAFWFGHRAWWAARAQAQLLAQGEELEQERERSAAQAVALDRVEIARELHDVVAHHVSVMGIQAAAARRSIAPDPTRAEAAMEVVEESARTTIAELQRLVHTLRDPHTEVAGEASTVGIAQLAVLVAESQRAGVPTTLVVAGEPRPIPLLVDVALYRTVQEALTNVRKHAGRHAEASVRLRFAPDFVEVEISDDGITQQLGHRPGRSGLGLRGMRERIGAVGGHIAAGRRERGGFLVSAHVPLASYAGPRRGGTRDAAASAAPTDAAENTATVAV